MVRDECPSSDSGEERHDRFRSERNEPKSGGLKLGCRLEERRRSPPREKRDRRRRDEWERSVVSPEERRKRRRREPNKYHPPPSHNNTRSKNHSTEIKYPMKEEDTRNGSSHKRKKHKSHKKRHKERHGKGGSSASEERGTHDQLEVESVSGEGPALVPPLKEESAEEGEIVSDGEKMKRVMGPRLPERAELPVDQGDNLYGPALPPPSLLPNDDQHLPIGPLPQGMINPCQKALEARAAFFKRQLESKEDVESEKVRREEWMLELPQVRAQALGLGPRKFRAKEGPDLSDQSIWTDTPAHKLKKQALAQGGIVSDVSSGKEQLERAWIEERDKAMEVLAKEGSKVKKRELSLLELHQKEQRKKKKKEKKEKGDGKVERRPFNRETDLQVNRFDEAQKKSILKKAQLLNTRFLAGESKFL